MKHKKHKQEKKHVRAKETVAISPSRTERYKQIPLGEILEPRLMMRGNIDEHGIVELEKSIREVGLLCPLLVKKMGDSYCIVAGHRRLLALQRGGFKEADCIVLTDADVRLSYITLHENLMRENVNVVDEAQFLKLVIDGDKITQKQLAKKICKSEAYVSERISLLATTEDVVAAVRKGVIGIGVARELARVRDDAEREYLLKHAIENGVTADVAQQWRIQANLRTEQREERDDGEETEVKYSYPTVPRFECFRCKNNIKVHEIRLIRVCQDCDIELSKLFNQL